MKGEKWEGGNVGRLQACFGRAVAAKDAAAARAIIAQAMEAEQTKQDSSLIGSAFEADMRPVCKAIVSSLQAGDMEAMRGLRAMLPHLLAEVNREPALAEALAFQLGKSLVQGMTAKPEDEV